MSTQSTAAGVPFLRTPDERFTDLPDFPWEPNYLEVDGFRMAYLDEGPTDGSKPTVLLLHGEPSWSYLYRRMIPTLVEAGHRIIAPDLIGFGRSDKPTERSAYTYDGHVGWMHQFLDQILASDPSIGPLATFVQDWGGLIGLRVAAERPDDFAFLCAGNTGLPIGESLGDGFDFWLNLSQTADPFDCGQLLQGAIATRELTEAEQDAYRAPFPDESYLAGAREFPCLVPITPEHDGVAANIAAREVLAGWTKPVLTLWGRADFVLGHLDADLRALIPGTAGQPHQVFEDASHFVQDDVGEPLAQAMVDWLDQVA
ncbi:MAG: haloalkane dehalogenase [Acidimicrobiales bacterium]|nr:MAG: haloalkane dehalogenase [Acidimicrobiales bacterium]